MLIIFTGFTSSRAARVSPGASYPVFAYDGLYPGGYHYENAGPIFIDTNIEIDEDDTEYDEEGKPVYKETAGRRAEIIFILSLPLVMIAHTLVIGGLNMAASNSTEFKLGPEAIAFALVSSLSISIAITYWDYQEVYGDKTSLQGKRSERVRYLSAYHRF